MMRREFVGLQQGEHFPKLVHGAEAPREDDQRFCHLREPELAHEKIVEIEIQIGRDVAIRSLLVRELDAEADGWAASFGGAAIGCFHDAGSAAGAADEAARL